MRLFSVFAIVVLSCQVVSAQSRNWSPDRSKANPPAAQNSNQIQSQQSETQLVVADFRVAESVEGKEQVIANPRMAVPSGQTGEISIGSQLPGAPAAEKGQPANDQYFVGTKIITTPTIRRDGKIQLNFKLRISQVEPKQATDSMLPKISVRELTHSAIASPGQTVGVSGFKVGDTETRIHVTPRIMSASAAMKDAAMR